MERNCVLCLDGFDSGDYWWYFAKDVKVDAGELLHLDKGKIYNDNNDWVCDLYSEEGLSHFMVIENYGESQNVPEQELDDDFECIFEKFIQDVMAQIQPKGFDALNPKLISKIVDYSMTQDRYREMKTKNILEGVDACLYYLKNNELPEDMTKKDLILDLSWLSIILLDREMRDD